MRRITFSAASIMRLSDHEAELIRKEVEAQFGDRARVLLFGSRLNDRARGGDVDLLVETDQCPENSALAAARLEARLQRRLGGRKVDVILLTPQTTVEPIHRQALATGVPL